MLHTSKSAWDRVVSFVRHRFQPAVANTRQPTQPTQQVAIDFLRTWTAQDTHWLKLYSQFVKPGDVCFDIGANLGNRVKIFLRLAAQVVVVEPQSQCISVLTEVYGSDPRVSLIQKVAGAQLGYADLLVNETSMLSSLSQDWIAAVKKSGRFTPQHWNRIERVGMTTLDRLIDHHGSPGFIKVDVEGFEYEVIRGLTRPVRALSLEFAREYMEPVLRSIAYLETLGNIRLNYARAETARLALEDWVAPQAMREVIAGFSSDPDPFLWGDVYIRFLPDQVSLDNP